MLGSPVWRGNSRYAFYLGLLCGALAAAAGFLVIGSLVRAVPPAPMWPWLLAVFATAVVLREFGIVRLWLPENKRLVPEAVRRHGRFFGPLQFGFEMGTGMRTYLPSGLPYVLAMSIAVLASPGAALAGGLGFAVGRSLMTLGNLRFDRDGSWDLAWIAQLRTIKAMLVAAFLVPFGLLLLW